MITSGIILITPSSFPGIVLDENKKRSPSLSLCPLYLPGHVYKELDVPIYARKFTASIARKKLEEHKRKNN